MHSGISLAKERRFYTFSACPKREIRSFAASAQFLASFSQLLKELLAVYAFASFKLRQPLRDLLFGFIPRVLFIVHPSSLPPPDPTLLCVLCVSVALCVKLLLLSFTQSPLSTPETPSGTFLRPASKVCTRS